MNVSRSGYYAWCKRRPSQRQQANAKLWYVIQAIYKEGRGYYGYRRVHARLCQLGHNCGRNRVFRLMKKHNLQAKGKRSYRRMTRVNIATLSF